MKSPFSAVLLLLALACRPAPDTPSEAVPDTPGNAATKTGAVATEPWFREIGDVAGLRFTHSSGLDGSFFFPEHVGSGGALFDYDGDGDLDVYLVTSGRHGATREELPPVVDRLFRQDGDGTFVDVTASSGLGEPGYGMGCAVGDVEGDGDLDLYLTAYGRDAFYRNDGDGTFTEATAAAGLGDERWGTSACFFDHDGDGHLDLYLVTYVHLDPPRACTDASGRPEYCGPAAFAGVPDRLYRGRGDGTFVEIGTAAGIALGANRGLGLVCVDLDGDRRPEVYVANDGEANNLWHNLGPGPDGTVRFEDRGALLGAATNQLGKPEASMGVALGDVDGDERLDIFLAHLDRETNTFYRNLGEAGFQDVTAASGLGPASLQYTGFGTIFFDADHDADLDLLVVNGRVRRGPPLPGADVPTGAAAGDVPTPDYWRHYAEPNLFFVRDGDVFRDASAETGELCSRVEVSRSVLAGDLDLDGALDVLVTACNGPARLYRNQGAAGRRWLQVRVFDPALGRDALGTEVVAETPGHRQLRVVTSTDSYLASVEPRVHFGLADAESVDLHLRFPDGHDRRIVGLPADRVVTVYR